MSRIKALIKGQEDLSCAITQRVHALLRLRQSRRQGLLAHHGLDPDFQLPTAASHGRLDCRVPRTNRGLGARNVGEFAVRAPSAPLGSTPTCWAFAVNTGGEAFDAAARVIPAALAGIPVLLQVLNFFSERRRCCGGREVRPYRAI